MSNEINEDVSVSEDLQRFNTNTSTSDVVEPDKADTTVSASPRS